jgi:DeoR/GlpR family transcriptional regulator of sugar metabolism
LRITGGHMEEMPHNFNTDKFFLGMAGISPEYGLTDYNPKEIQVRRQVTRCAKKVIVLADHTTLRRVTP